MIMSSVKANHNQQEQFMSKDNNLVSQSGAKIYRYTDGEKEWGSAQGEQCIEDIADHIEQYIGEVAMVFH
ncbi:MAG: hypothetical protein ACI9FJ_000727 [Alteromonadaceae bacterium]|jgi:hypothetical protein